MTPETGAPGGPGPRPRAVVGGGVALLAVFVGLALWGLGGPAGAPDPSGDADGGPGRSHAGGGASPRQSDPTPALPRTYPKGQLDAPRELAPLLEQKFQFTSRDGKRAFAQLRSALGSEPAITVINVWAPYCEPCKREFPAFRRLQTMWDEDVRFLPIQLGEGEPGQLADVMPLAPHHLIDYVPGGAVQQTLASLDLLSDTTAIPITLVLDCRHQLRWLQAQEVTDMATFGRSVDALRRELDTPACRVPPPLPNPSTAAKTCGNGVCEPLAFDEDCMTCPSDCGCKKDQLCATQLGAARHGHVCMDELQ